MPERALVLPVAATKHRRHPVRSRALDITARFGTAVTLSALLVFAGAAVGLSGPAPDDEGTQVVTFEIVGH